MFSYDLRINFYLYSHTYAVMHGMGSRHGKGWRVHGMGSGHGMGGGCVGAFSDLFLFCGGCGEQVGS